MAITAEYFVRKIPDTKEYEELHYAFEQDGKPDAKGNVRTRMVQKTVITKGGWLIIFPNGHSIRLATEDQLKHFGLEQKAKLVDRNSGLEVNQHGIPVALQHLINTERQPDGDAEVLDGMEADPINDTLKEMGVS